MTKDPMSFAQAMKEYFGTRTQGEGAAKSFMDEWKELTDADKQFFKEELQRIGYVLK